MPNPTVTNYITVRTSSNMNLQPQVSTGHHAEDIARDVNHLGGGEIGKIDFPGMGGEHSSDCSTSVSWAVTLTFASQHCLWRPHLSQLRMQGALSLRMASTIWLTQSGRNEISRWSQRTLLLHPSTVWNFASLTSLKIWLVNGRHAHDIFLTLVSAC